MRNLVAVGDRRLRLELGECGAATQFAVAPDEGLLYVAGEGLAVQAHSLADGQVGEVAAAVAAAAG